MPEASRADAGHRYHVLANAWASFGAAHFLKRLGGAGRPVRGWIVTVEGTDTPTVFKRKGDALEHAERRVQATLERLREGAQRDTEE